MLLRHTNPEIQERAALTINPAKTCQPIGALYAALGVHGCLPHSHGSQGCCSYHRSTLSRHYKEPVMAATSSFTEGSSVFGGQANLLTAIDNIFNLYKPEVLAVHTTCLSETIGDDLLQISTKAKDEGKVPEGREIVYTNTPSYVGSHVTGFSNMVNSFVKQLAVKGATKTKTINLLPGWVEPSDMRELKRLAGELGVSTIMLPDTSDVLDSPQTGKFEMYPKGGTTKEEIRLMGSAAHTLAMGETTSADAAGTLEKNCEVPYTVLDLPIGLAATDRFVDTLRRVAGVTVPDEVTRERGRLLDLISDTHQYLHGKRVALWGDPDQLVALSEFLVTLDMRPVYVVTGTPGKRFEERMAAVVGERVPECRYRQGLAADMFLMHQWIKAEPVDLLIGNTYGKYIARDEDLPFVRHGFPIIDRVGHSYFPTVGYTGAMRLLEKILGVFQDRQDRDAPEERFELVL